MLVLTLNMHIIIKVYCYSMWHNKKININHNILLTFSHLFLSTSTSPLWSVSPHGRPLPFSSTMEGSHGTSLVSMIRAIVNSISLMYHRNFEFKTLNRNTSVSWHGPYVVPPSHASDCDVPGCRVEPLGWSHREGGGACLTACSRHGQSEKQLNMLQHWTFFVCKIGTLRVSEWGGFYIAFGNITATSWQETNTDINVPGGSERMLFFTQLTQCPLQLNLFLNQQDYYGNNTYQIKHILSHIFSITLIWISPFCDD